MLPDRLRTGSRNPLAATALAAFLAAALAACGGGGGHRSAATTAPTSTTTVVTGAGSAPGLDGYDWARETDPTLALGGGPTATIGGVLAPGPGANEWIVVGTTIALNGTQAATVWTSSGGTTWSAQALSTDTTATQAWGVTRWNSDIVVVGSTGTGSEQRAAVWISSGPGQAFTKATVSAQPGSVMRYATAGALGVFAAGESGGRLALWSSTNGGRWIESTGAEDMFADTAGAQVNTILATNNPSDNYVFAAGSIQVGTATDAALWASPDGINWHFVTSAQSAFSGTGDRVITSLAPLGTGLVAVGGIKTATAWSPVSWISPDGASWSQPSEDFPMDPRSHYDPNGSLAEAVSSATTTTGAYQMVAVGGSDVAQRMWTSSDGVRWHEVALASGAANSANWRATLTATSATGATVVADGEFGQPYVLVDASGGWTQPSANPGVFGPVLTTARPIGLVAGSHGMSMIVALQSGGQVLGSGMSSVVKLESTNADTWTVATSSALDGTAAPSGSEAVARFGSDLLAVGVDATTDQAVAWVSSDGVRWSDPSDLDSPAGIAPETAGGVCILGVRPIGPSKDAKETEAAVAVGSADQRGPGSAARTWYSHDGVHWKLGTVTPTPVAGGTETMAGCFEAGSDLVAFGESTGANGTAVPALWESTNGVSWTRVDPGGFGAGPAPLVDMFEHGSTWLAAASSTTDTTAMESNSGLWLSTDAGSAWSLVNTDSAGWDAAQPVQLGQVAILTDGRLIVAGTAAGRLAVWVGEPSTPALSTATTAMAAG